MLQRRVDCLLSRSRINPRCSEHPGVVSQRRRNETAIAPCDGQARLHVSGFRTQLKWPQIASYFGNLSFVVSSSSIIIVIVNIELFNVAEEIRSLEGP